MKGVAQRAGTGLLAALGYGGRFFTLEVISASSAFLYFVGLLTHVNYFLFTEFGFPCCLGKYETDAADVQFNFGDNAPGPRFCRL